MCRLVSHFGTALLLVLGGLSNASATYHAALGEVESYVYRDGEWIELQNPAQADDVFGSTDLIRQVGARIWQLVLDNELTVESEDRFSHALPSGISDPMQLTGWRSRRSDTVKVIFRDVLGGSVAELDYHLSFDSDGTRQTRGRYLANANVVIENLEVKTFYSLDVKIRALAPTNIGNGQSPVAMMKFQIEMSVRDNFLGGTKLATDEITITGRGLSSVTQKSESRN